MTTRTDVHRPSAIQPEDYEFVDCKYIGCAELDPFECMANAEAMRNIERHRKATGGRYSGHEHGGTCHVCGAFALYLAVWYHPKTNSYIQMGQDCCQKMDMGDVEAFNPLRRAIANAKEAKAGKMKAAAMLEEWGLTRAWELYNADDDELRRVKAIDVHKWQTEECYCGGHLDWNRVLLADCPHCHGIGKRKMHEQTREYRTRDYDTLCDVISKLVNYGRLSEKQVAFLKTLVHRIDNRAEVEAERQAEHDALPDCPNGRTTIVGEVLKTEVRESMYGSQLKMLVKTDAGYKVWGTVPSTLSLVEIEREEGDDKWTEQRGLERGDKVQFSANLTRSDNDSKFGFYSRPTKAKLLVAVASE